MFPTDALINPLFLGWAHLFIGAGSRRWAKVVRSVGRSCCDGWRFREPCNSEAFAPGLIVRGGPYFKETVFSDHVLDDGGYLITNLILQSLRFIKLFKKYVVMSMCLHLRSVELVYLTNFTHDLLYWYPNKLFNLVAE